MRDLRLDEVLRRSTRSVCNLIESTRSPVTAAHTLADWPPLEMSR